MTYNSKSKPKKKESSDGDYVQASLQFAFSATATLTTTTIKLPAHVTARIEEQERLKRTEPNPMIRAWGYGPEGKQCKNCKNLVIHGDHARNYWKCLLRRITNGPATDHRVKWTACGKYEDERER
jgi:hypothetical protein